MLGIQRMAQLAEIERQGPPPLPEQLSHRPAAPVQSWAPDRWRPFPHFALPPQEMPNDNGDRSDISSSHEGTQTSRDPNFPVPLGPDPPTASALEGGSRDNDDDEDGPAAEEEFQRPRVRRDPGQPTAAEVEEHNVTHIPYRPWCEACNRGKARKKPSLRLCGAYAHSEHARVRMDYAKLTEVVEESDDGEQGDEDSENVENSQAMLVMQESQHTSVWSYAVERKGASEEWVVSQLRLE